MNIDIPGGLEPVGDGSSSKKRRRRPVSCWHCRIRKIKCNREAPCEACIKSGDAATCSYVSTQEVTSETFQPPQDCSNGNALEARIDRLESLLLSVVSNETDSGAKAGNDHSAPPGVTGPWVATPQSRSSTDEGYDTEKEREIEELSGRMGWIKVDKENRRTHYIGPSHWVSILSEISEFRNYLKAHAPDLEKEAIEKQAFVSSFPESSVSLLKGVHSLPSRDELLAWVPPRVIADELVTRFFTSRGPTVCIIHEPTFREEYARHWTSSSKPSLPWLSLLFAIFFNSESQREELLVQEPSTTFGNSEARILYRKLLIQSLLASNYTTPSEGTLEAILLYAEAEWLTSQDAVMEISLVLGMLIRLAMKMGLHKEWRAHPDMLPWQREMRRRTWTAIHCTDIMYSFQLSLPTNIRQEDVDLAGPNNLRDEDFGPHSTTLPPSRPRTELTQASYFITKYRQLLLLDQIVRLTESPKEPSKDEIRKYEDLLLESRKMTPPQLQINFAEKSSRVPIYLKKNRINIDRLYQVSQCVLHRRFLAQAHQDPKLMHYRRSCIDAAMNLLAHQADLYVTYSDVAYSLSVRRRHMFSLTSTDFFTAGMTIAMDLHHGLRAEPRAPKASDIKIWGFDRRPEMIAALDKSIDFWRIAKSDSIEAAKAWGLFSLIVNKAKTVLESEKVPLDKTFAQIPVVDQRLPGEEGVSDTSGEAFTASSLGLDFDWDLWNEWNTMTGDTTDLDSFLQFIPSNGPDISNGSAPKA